MTTTQAVQTSLTSLQKWKCARGGIVVLYKNGTDSLHVSVFVRKRSFFLQFGLPSTHIHWKRSPKTCLKNRWKRRFAVLKWMGENKVFVKTITCTSRCWIPVNVNAPIKDCTDATCGRRFLEGGNKCQFSSKYRYFIFKQLDPKWKKKQQPCNKKLEVATVFYIFCIFGGENFTLNVLYVAGKLPTYTSPKPTF